MSQMKSLKIAMLVRQFSAHGGLELYAHKVVEGLLDNGVIVTVVCQEKNSVLQDPKLTFKMIESPPRGLTKSARLRQLFAAANKAIRELESVDLVHSQHCPSAEADVVTFHNHTTERLSKVGLWWEGLLNDTKRGIIPAYRLRDEQDEILCRRALSLIFPAEVMKEDFFQRYPFLQGPPPKPYVVAYPGASLEQDSIPERTIASGTEFNFLFVGRGFRKKGLDVLLQACSILKSKTTRKFNLYIAGLKEKSADRLRLSLMGLGGFVHYLGFQKDMEAVYAKASVIILPSRVEPFGMAPIQGMQRGLVPIVSRVSGVCEALKAGHNALVLENQLDATELAGHMLRLMDDPKLLQTLSENALQSAASINWNETVGKTLEAYELALSLKRKERIGQ